MHAALCPSRPLPLSIAIPARVSMRLLNKQKQAEEANAAKVRRANQAAQIRAAPLHRAASITVVRPSQEIALGADSATILSRPSVYPVCHSPLTRRSDPRTATAPAAIAHQQPHYAARGLPARAWHSRFTVRVPLYFCTLLTHTRASPPDRAEERARQLGAQGGAQPQASEPSTTP